MPEEIAVIIIITIVSGTFLGVVKAILGYLASKHQLAGSKESRKRASTSDSSLTTSELQTLIRTAVEDANASLLARVEALEDQLDAEGRRLQAPQIDADLLEADDLATPEPALRRRPQSSTR